MTIVNLYQAALIVTIAGVVLAAQWAKRQMEAEARLASVAGAEPAPMLISKPQISESLKALNKLFDDNLISVDEYVELRRRANG